MNIPYNALSLFFDMYEKIISFNQIDDLNSRISYVNSILNDENLDDNYNIKPKLINNYVSYKNNGNLYIYILVLIVKKSIYNKIKNFKTDIEVDESNEIIKELMNQINEFEIYNKVNIYKTKYIGKIPNNDETIIYNKILNKIKKKEINNNINIEILFIKERIIFITKISSELFNDYFYNFAIFLDEIKDKFYERFKYLDIKGKDDDYELFTTFCVFISEYNFCKISNYLKDKWYYSISQTNDEINKLLKNNSNYNINKYRIENESLILEIYDIKNKNKTIIKINNYNSYIIKNIIDYLDYYYYKNLLKVQNKIKKKELLCTKIYNYITSYIFNIEINTNDFHVNEIIINEYKLEKYLKIDKINSSIFLKKISKQWNDYLIRIFTSKCIKSVFKEICKKTCLNFKAYDFLEENELNILLNNIKFVSFEMDECYGLTLPGILEIYEYYKIYNNNYSVNDCKLSFLAFNIITDEHEIIGHVNIRIQNMISKKEIKSPKINSNNNHESVEYIEILLYGDSVHELTYKEILFILDIKNYDCSYIDFKNHFLACNKREINISESLKNLFNEFNININNNSEESKIFYFPNSKYFRLSQQPKKNHSHK